MMDVRTSAVVMFLTICSHEASEEYPPIKTRSLSQPQMLVAYFDNILKSNSIVLQEKRLGCPSSG